MQGCLSEREMAEFVKGKAPPDRLVVWRRHLRLCDACATSVARLRVGIDSAPGAAEDSRTPVFPPAEGMPALGLEPNIQIGGFRLERRLGSGGMGVVYQALQLDLNRRVALKVLALGPAADSTTLERFHREARAAAGLHHPNIVTIHAAGTEGHTCYFAMEMIEGENLDQVIRYLRAARAFNAVTEGTQMMPSPLMTDPSAQAGANPPDRPACTLRDCTGEKEYFDTVARLMADIADALHYAHGKGIIHRDIKPSNLMLSRDGRLVLLDFGTARVRAEQAMTLSGSFVGTPRYMSPEQIAGTTQGSDHRCDIYAFGVTLYELLTLEPPFDGDTQERVITQILSSEPRRLRQVNRHIPVDLETICHKAMEKYPNQRYATAEDLAEDLRRYLSGRPIRAKRRGPTTRLIMFVRRHRVVTALIFLLTVACVAAGVMGWRYYTTRWARQFALVQIDRLMGQDDYFAAWNLANRAARYIPDDPLLISRRSHLSRELTIATNPSGAKVFLGEYPRRNPHWKYLGRAPLRNVRIPFGTYRWRVERPGFLPLEVVRSNDLPSPSVDPANLSTAYMGFILHRHGEIPSDMAWIPPSDLDQNNMFHGERHIAAAPAFLIDKYEVTNAQYQEFVDNGGYSNPVYWEEPFVKDGAVLAREQAMALLCDRSGRPGPATWKDGTCPPGQGDYPVGGVSWYEAAAYARFRGKHLPTIFHWLLAAGSEPFAYRVASFSNFSGSASSVGQFQAMGAFGLYDTAGNVREWCYNAIAGTDGLRSILGGAWSDHEYAFVSGEVRSPWDRDSANGLRCATYLGGREAVPEAAFLPVERKHRDFTHFEPVSDEVLDSYINTWYKYDRTALNARVELADETLGYCRRERITFDAAYPNERVIAYLYLPRSAKPPFQTIVWYPGGEARDNSWDDRAHKHEMTTIIQSGRALIVPFYKGTYERRLDKPFYPADGIQSRNLYVQGSQDMRRAIDYLETREDIDTERLAFVGLSWGGQMGTLMIAVEPRFKTGILLLGGICACERHPASDPANFAPRVRIPMLMINAKEDSLFPYETAQKPLFNLLGTAEAHKRHILLPGGHGIPWEYHKQYYGEIVRWLNERLGPTDRTSD